MHVGLVIYGSLDTLSGGYLYDRELVGRLQACGDQVTLVSLPGQGYARRWLDNWTAGLAGRLAQLPLDVLLQDELCHPSLFAMNRQLRRRARFPLVSIVHHLRSSEAHPGWKRSIYRQVERSYLNSLDGFIFNSQTTSQTVHHLLSTSCRRRMRCAVVYPAGDRLAPQISDEQIAQRSLAPGPLRIFFLGNVIPRKGLHTLLSALHGIPWNQWELRVAGRLDADIFYARHIRRLVALDGMVGSVHFLGPLSEAQLVEQMTANHVLVIPSSYEGYGIAYLEGMGFGLPAIATTAGAAGEIITDGVDGYLVPPADKNALRERLAELAGDRPRLLELSLAARRRYLSQPTWEAAMTQAVDFLHTFNSS